jgi:hypothetical protein
MLLYLEALLAGAILVGVVWWTWPKHDHAEDDDPASTTTHDDDNHRTRIGEAATETPAALPACCAKPASAPGHEVSASECQPDDNRDLNHSAGERDTACADSGDSRGASDG